MISAYIYIQVPLDLIVRVLDTTGYDEAQHTFALKADGPYAGNAYVVRISCVYQYISVYVDTTHTSPHTHMHTCT